MQNLFEIQSYQVNSSNIVVTLSDANYTEETEVRLNRSKFEGYLDRNCLLATAMQYHDEEGTVETAPCTITIPEYYQHADVVKDLYEYILNNQGEQFFAKALKSLEVELNQYQN